MRASQDWLDAWDSVAVAMGLALGLAGGVVALVVVAAEGPGGLLVAPIAVCAAAGALMFAGMSSAARRRRPNGKKGSKGGPYRDAAEVVPDAPIPQASPGHPIEEDDEDEVQPVVGKAFDGMGEPRSTPPLWSRIVAAAVYVASLAVAAWISGWFQFGR